MVVSRDVLCPRVQPEHPSTVGRSLWPVTGQPPTHMGVRRTVRARWWRFTMEVSRREAVVAMPYAVALARAVERIPEPTALEGGCRYEPK